MAGLSGIAQELYTRGSRGAKAHKYDWNKWGNRGKFEAEMNRIKKDKIVSEESFLSLKEYLILALYILNRGNYMDSTWTGMYSVEKVKSTAANRSIQRFLDRPRVSGTWIDRIY